MSNLPAVIERVITALGKVYELVRERDRAGFVALLQATDGGRRYYAPDAKLLESPDFCPGVYHVRRHSVALAVPRQERDFSAGILAYRYQVRRFAVGRVDLDLFLVRKEPRVVDARATYYANVCLFHQSYTTSDSTL